MKKGIKVIVFLTTIIANTLSAQTIADGLRLMENENYTEAQKVLEAVIAKEPKNALPWYYLGELKYILEDYKSAEEAYNKGLLVSNKCNECSIGLAKLKLDKGMDVEAIKLLDGLAKSNKKNAPFLALIGDAFLYSKKPIASKAIEYLTKSRDIDPNVASTWSHMGDAHRLAGDMGSAMTAYEIAVEKDKTNLEAYMSMAKIWANSRQVELGIEKLEEAIKLAPDYAPALKDLYELYIRTKQFGKVVPILDRYVSLSGDDIKAKVRLVKFLSFQAKDYERAIAEGEKLNNAFSQAAGNAQDDKFYTINRWLAWSYCGTDKYQECYDASLKFFADVQQDTSRKSYQIDYEHLAKAAMKLKKYDEASLAYNKVMEFDPSKAEEVYGNLAKAFYDDKQYEKSMEFYTKKNAIRELGITDLYTMGLIYYKIDSFAQCDKIFEKIVTLSPNYATGWLYRARCADEQDPDKTLFTALPFYTKYIEVASLEKEKNKKYLPEAYNYLGFNLIKTGNYESGKAYFELSLGLDPSNAEATDYLAQLSGASKDDKKN